MAPKKRPRCVTPSKAPKPKCPPVKKCPVPTPVPKLIIKGGVEVLNIITGPDATTEIELFLNPRMGINSGTGTGGKWYGYSEVIHHSNGSSSSDQLLSTQMPSYSCARVQLPMLNTDMTCETLRMWEAVSCKTEVVGIGTLINLHLLEAKNTASNGAARPIEGINYHMFAIGGEPLDLQGMEANGTTSYASAVPAKSRHTNDIAKVPLNDVGLLQGLVTAAKAKLDKDGFYPVEEWCPDPSRNENTRYFGSFVGGLQTPPALQFTNSVSTVLLDENGIGPLCKGDGLFVSCADICGIMTKQDNEAVRYRGLPRYFKITLRQRAVRNPYPITSLLGSLFTGLMPKIDGQPMTGKYSQIEEVRVYEGKEGLPADPDLKRYVDQFGQEKTEIPTPAAAPAAVQLLGLRGFTWPPPGIDLSQGGYYKGPVIREETRNEAERIKKLRATLTTVEDSEETQEMEASPSARPEVIVESNLITQDFTSNPPLQTSGTTTNLQGLSSS
ncbi:VP1 [Tupaia glis polyomavirus 1]|uniref:VP1 n=1 Tax=Tupaia glis polyomavirus 1 TaxID=2170402 RepID=A0A2S1CJR9_9POLY|nr:VP1 [Tupaia glis polyomavirus 1]AWD33806.1 VP1 [Tupaia glis polyomavirus 1]AWD33810.1 VP1 [Tupaia glis polyomavirus 1]AWD33819.1 VP1 [Tupaia glis polyomavirus 1]